MRETDEKRDTRSNVSFTPVEDARFVGIGPVAMQDVTQLLERWATGDRSALPELLPLVEAELHRMAHHFMRRERRGHLLQTTALLNEAYVQLAGQPIRSQNRAHFFGIASTIMRRILVDHARKHRAGKRGGDVEHLALEMTAVAVDPRDIDLVALDDALAGLAVLDPRKARVVELRFFGGLTGEETATVLNVDERTVKRDWSFARAWLLRRMSEANDDG